MADCCLKITRSNHFLEGILEVFELRLKLFDVVCPLFFHEFNDAKTLGISGQLGKYLKTCRVKVIDQDTFPSSFYAKELQENLENAEEVNQMGLFIEYVKLVARCTIHISMKKNPMIYGRKSMGSWGSTPVVSPYL